MTLSSPYAVGMGSKLKAGGARLSDYRSVTRRTTPQPRKVSLTIELTPEQESRLAAFPRQAGMAPAEVVKKLVEEYLPPLVSPSLPEQEQARRVKVLHELAEETERLGLYK